MAEFLRLQKERLACVCDNPPQGRPVYNRPMPTPTYILHQGTTPLLISIPHAGTHLPPDIAAQLTPTGRGLLDTDWHVDALYDFAADEGASVLVATHSRTVVDLNRNPEGGRLYPGQHETTVCPTETFAGAPLYPALLAPAEIARRIPLYWTPYHQALTAELARIQARHGAAHLLDAHSIRGEIPRLFPGPLPDLNYGTNNGASASEALTARALAATAPHPFTTILNGRFLGGHITRHYGRPSQGIHAIQLELAQRTYTDEAAPDLYDPTRAGPLKAALRALVQELSKEAVLF